MLLAISKVKILSRRREERAKFLEQEDKDMMISKRRQREIEKELIERKLKENPLEKGDLLAIFIAAFSIFIPYIVIPVVIFIFLVMTLFGMRLW